MASDVCVTATALLVPGSILLLGHSIFDLKQLVIK